MTTHQLPIARGLGAAADIRWPLFPCGDLFELRYGRALTSTARRPGSVPVFGSNGQTGVHDTALFQGPGVILGRKGMGHLGVEWVDSDYWVIDTAYSLVPLTDIDLKFAYYLIRHVGLDHLKHGTSNPSLTRDAFAAQLLPVPPRAVQLEIAGLLTALDDKIVANTRVTDGLSELADAHFARAVSSASSGELTFGDLADVSGGGTPRTTVDDYWGGGVRWATPTDVTGLAAPYLTDTSRTITPEGLAACSSALYPAGSILMTSRATIGAFAIAEVPTAVNQGFIVVNANDPAQQWWLFHEMKSRVPEFLSFANGATFLELPRGRFKQLKVRLADDHVMREFGSLVGPMHSAAAQFSTESKRLAATRDELLPLLMSGKVRVRDAEKALEEVL